MKAFFSSFIILLIAISTIQSQNHELWGVTAGGGVHDGGTVYQLELDGSEHEIVHDFSQIQGGWPMFCEFTSASNSKLIAGINGGRFGNGIFIEYDIETNKYVELYCISDDIQGYDPTGKVLYTDDNNLFGMTRSGGVNNLGVLYKLNLNNMQYSKLIDFDGENGANPIGSLLLSSNGSIYGMTSGGGDDDSGVIFNYNIESNQYNKVHDFGGADNGHPYGALVENTNGLLYGLSGSLFSLDPTNNNFEIISSFGGYLGEDPMGSLMLADDGMYYGITTYGGYNNGGTIFQFDPNFSQLNVVYNCNDDESLAFSPITLVQAMNGKLYGLTYSGGDDNDGRIFEYDIVNNTYSDKYSLNDSSGYNPLTSFVKASNEKLYAFTMEGGIDNHGTIIEYDPITDEFVKKLDLSYGESGNYPYGHLLQASNGKIYGTTSDGGVFDYGVLYEIDPSYNTYTVICNFDGDVMGATPYAGLTDGLNGKLYGLTSYGGYYNDGVLFEFDYINNEIIKKVNLHENITGAYPRNGLVLATNGLLYGATGKGGEFDNGCIFKYDPVNEICEFEYSFNSEGFANLINLMQADNDKFYGTVGYFYNNEYDYHLFEYEILTKTLTNKYHFSEEEGAPIVGSLIQASNSLLYGVSRDGGENGFGTIFSYQINLEQYEICFEFDGIDSGENPYGALFETSDGLLVGIAKDGGEFDKGTIFMYDIDNNSFEKKLDFNSYNGRGPYRTSLIEVSYIPLGNVNENPKENCLVYPNPSKGIVFINDNELVDIEIHDVMANKILSIKNHLSREQIDLSFIPSGIYFLHIKKNEVVSVSKLIKL